MTNMLKVMVFHYSSANWIRLTFFPRHDMISALSFASFLKSSNTIEGTMMKYPGIETKEKKSKKNGTQKGGRMFYLCIYVYVCVSAKHNNK